MKSPLTEGKMRGAKKPHKNRKPICSPAPIPATKTMTELQERIFVLEHMSASYKRDLKIYENYLKEAQKEIILLKEKLNEG